MNENLKELLLLNRLIMFDKLLSENMVKPEIYVKKVEEDLKFIGSRLEVLYNNIQNNDGEIKRYHKVYCNVFRKYFSFTETVIADRTFMDSKLFDYKTIMALERDVKEYYENLKNGPMQEKRSYISTQYINENEYSMLLSQLED